MIGYRHPMNLRMKLKINWWLWASLSISLVVFSWIRPREIKGAIWSDWNYLIHYLHQTNYVITHDISDFLLETVFWSVVPAFLIGWIAQYLIVLTWQARSRWRTPSHTNSELDTRTVRGKVNGTHEP